jgi:hypothetical protein
MNLQEIIDEIKRYGFGDLDYNEAAIKVAVNAAYGEVQSEGAFPFTEAGPSTVTLTDLQNGVARRSLTDIDARFNKVRTVSHNQTKLRYLEPDEFFQLRISDSATSGPLYYTIWNGQLQVWKLNSVDGVSLQMYYHRTFPDLSISTDVPAMPSRYHYLLVIGALKRMYSATDEDDKASFFTELWSQGLDQMKADIPTVEFDRTELIGSSYSLGSISKMVREHGFTDIGNSIIQLYANQVIREISSQYNLTFLERGPEEFLIDGDLLTLPADCAKPRRIMINDGNGRRMLENRMIDDLWEDIEEDSETTTGRPEAYAIWGTDTSGRNQIRIYPTPDRPYEAKIWYLSTPAQMAQIGDTPPLPAQHHGLVLYGVLYKCSLAATDEVLASKIPIYKQEFDERVSEMLNDMMRPTLDKPHVITDVNFE